MTEAWEEVHLQKRGRIEEIQGRLPDYSYSDKESSEATDKKLCQLLTQKIQKAEDRTSSIISLFFNLQLKTPDDEIQELKDELDIFSDEIESEPHNWKPNPKEFLQRIVEDDFHLLEGTEHLNQLLEDLQGKALEIKKKFGGKSIEIPEAREELLNGVEKAKEKLDRLVYLFKERDLVLKAEPISMEETLEKIEEELSAKYG